MKKRGWGNERGQAATEYMLILAVIVLGVLAAASAFVPEFKKGVNTLSSTVTNWLERDPSLCDPNSTNC